MGDDPVTEAERLLDGVWTLVAGSRVIPVDPVRIATELGIDVFEAELEPSVSAAIVKKVGRDPSILLSKIDHPNRQRFSCAHELGHFIRRSTNDPDAFEYVDFRDPDSSTGEREEERFANTFAANLLMPEKEARERYRATPSSVELAFTFKVSQESIVNRLKNLGLPVA